MLDERLLLALPVRVGHRLSSEITAIARREDPQSTCPPRKENASSVAIHPHPRSRGGGYTKRERIFAGLLLNICKANNFYFLL